MRNLRSLRTVQVLRAMGSRQVTSLPSTGSTSLARRKLLARIERHTPFCFMDTKVNSTNDTRVLLQFQKNAMYTLHNYPAPW